MINYWSSGVALAFHWLISGGELVDHLLSIAREPVEHHPRLGLASADHTLSIGGVVEHRWSTSWTPVKNWACNGRIPEGHRYSIG